MCKDRLEQEQVSEQARNLRKKSSAHIDFEYRSQGSQDLVTELNKLE